MTVLGGKKVKRPVRWTSYSQRGCHVRQLGRDHVPRPRVACDDKGKFLALRPSDLRNLGALLRILAPSSEPEAARPCERACNRLPAVLGQC